MLHLVAFYSFFTLSYSFLLSLTLPSLLFLLFIRVMSNHDMGLWAKRQSFRVNIRRQQMAQASKQRIKHFIESHIDTETRMRRLHCFLTSNSIVGPQLFLEELNTVLQEQDITGMDDLLLDFLQSTLCSTKTLLSNTHELQEGSNERQLGLVIQILTSICYQLCQSGEYFREIIEVVTVGLNHSHTRADSITLLMTLSSIEHQGSIQYICHSSLLPSLLKLVDTVPMTDHDKNNIIGLFWNLALCDYSKGTPFLEHIHLIHAVINENTNQDVELHAIQLMKLLLKRHFSVVFGSGFGEILKEMMEFGTSSKSLPEEISDLLVRTIHAKDVDTIVYLIENGLIEYIEETLPLVNSTHHRSLIDLMIQVVQLGRKNELLQCLDNVDKIVSIFLKSYTEFDPQVRESVLRLLTIWGVDRVCATEEFLDLLVNLDAHQETVQSHQFIITMVEELMNTGSFRGSVQLLEMILNGVASCNHGEGDDQVQQLLARIRQPARESSIITKY